MVFAIADGDPVDVRFDNPAAVKSIMLRNCVALREDVLLGYSEGPQLIWRCPPDWSERAYRVEVEFAFDWLACGPVSSSPPTNFDSLLLLGRRAAVKARTLWSSARQDAYGRQRQGP